MLYRVFEKGEKSLGGGGVITGFVTIPKKKTKEVGNVVPEHKRLKRQNMLYFWLYKCTDCQEIRYFQSI